MQAVAKLKNVTMSARKMRLVVDNIRGQKVEDAINILRFTKKEAAVWLEKLVRSAVANWEYKLEGNESADEYNLYIKTAFVDGGTIVKRFRPAPHGRAHRIREHPLPAPVLPTSRLAPTQHPPCAAGTASAPPGPVAAPL